MKDKLITTLLTPIIININATPSISHKMKPFSAPLAQQYSMSKIPTLNPGYGATPLPKSASNKNFGRVMGLPAKKKEMPKMRNFNGNGAQLRDRISRSIQEIPHLQSDDESGPLFAHPTSKTATKNLPLKKSTKHKQTDQILIQNCEQTDDQLFTQSYQKLNRVYTNFQNYKNRNSIQEQLSQILALIREERGAIKSKLEEIQMKKLRKGTGSVSVVDCGQNTEAIISGKDELVTRDAEIQTDIPIHSPSQQVASNQTYAKLIKILQDMNINSKQILPSQIKISQQQIRSDPQRKYQQLKQSEIITVQKFVIKKLVQRITSLQEGGNGGV